jgi:ketosteroid isomerase-like protein
MFKVLTTGLGAALALSISVNAGAAATAPANAPATTPAAKPAAVAQAAPKGPSDKAQIDALEKRFAAAFNAKDVNAIMAVYAKQGLFVFDVTPPREHVGWDDYKKDWEGFLGSVKGPAKFEISDYDVAIVGPVAYGHSIQSIHTSGPDQDIVVRVTDVYRKAGGKWRIVQEHVSVPVDLATGKGDLLSKP